VFVLLLDERPEEVTDFKDNVPCEVIASTFDERPEHHIKTAEKVLNRAKRLVEQDKDVIILMDSITRLARAYNATVTSSGKTLTGGLDAQALAFPKRFFGSARNVKKGGSLTIIATALIDTGSRLDDVIYEEFKGTGNMELFLSRDLSEKRVFPAVNVLKSGTRKEEKLFSESELDGVYKLRRFLFDKKDAMEILLEMIEKSKDNRELLEKLDGWVQIYGKNNEIK
jgi:transcription termination factor Rho